MIFNRHWKDTLQVYFFSLFKVPLLNALSCRVEKRTNKDVIVSVPLKRKTKNYYNAMYFGSLTMGAEMAIMYMAETLRKQNSFQYTLISKRFEANFIRRAHSRVYFSCDGGTAIQEAITQAGENNQRVTIPISCTAYTKSKQGQKDTVANFMLELSIKVIP